MTNRSDVSEVCTVNQKLTGIVASAVGVLLAASSAWAANVSGLPGDRGRLGSGVQPLTQSQVHHPGWKVPGPPIALAVEAARAIASGCRQYHLGVAVVNSQGQPILGYIPDGSNPMHFYWALRKAYTAVIFKVPTSQLVAKAQHDPAFAARIKANPNFMAFIGGLPLKVNGKVIGAIGVSGSEPGHHDEQCGMIGLRKIDAALMAASPR
jgi:uncharacterized protein GlcG (DUF336 family)